MSETFTCDDKDQLVAFLYDELGEDARRRVAEHLRICAACADEVAGLTHVREELAAWAPPAADLGFTIVPTARTADRPPQVRRPARWWAPSSAPAWARAAAAVLVLAAGLSIANLQVRYGAEGFVITTGWMAPATPPPTTAAVAATPASTAAAPAASADWRPALAALEASLREEIQAARSGAVAAGTPAARGNGLTPERIAELIEQSERRQRQELALRLTQFGRDLEVQRRSDLVRINQGFGQFEGRAGAEIARQRQMLDYIMRVSAQPPPQ
ncbi:MAG: anti-sigma factor [Vicinamibacterales bacterium]